MTPHVATQGRQAMRPRARLMLTLGLELISSESVAVLELVKNSYDADASTVLISLRETDDGQSAELLVLDDGIGMSAQAVTGTWLEPATPSRRHRKVSPAGRRSLGEKGLGRFATARLADQLELVTRSAGPLADEVWLAVDWTAFADDNAYLDAIEIPWGIRPAATFADRGEAAELWRSALAQYDAARAAGHGTTPDSDRGAMVRMTKLRTTWNGQLIQSLSQALTRLISPAADESLQDSSRDFRILLDLPPRLGEYAGWIGPPDELSRPAYRVSATVDTDGTAEVRLRLRDDPAWRPPARERYSGITGDQPRCGPFTFSMLVWDRDVDAIADVAPGVNARDFRRVLDQAAGVSIYRDGFRVLPYGELGDDWLHLDRRRINDPSRRLSNNQVAGAVQIGRDSNPELIDQTNREGIVEGPALQDLRHVILEIIVKLESMRYDSRPHVIRPPRSRTSALETLQLTELREAVEARNDPQLAAMVETAQDQLNEHGAEVREVVSRYQRLATLGQLVDRIVHEIAQPTVSARHAAAAGLETIEDSAKALDDPCRELVGRLQEEFRTVQNQTRVITEVVRRLQPFGGRRRGRPHIIVVEEAMRDVCRILRKDIEDRRITMSIPTTHTSVTVDQTELQEVLLNLVSNSLYWITRGPRDRERRIAFEVVREASNELRISVSDTGPGVPVDQRDRIFEPYFTTREGGVGLGLTLAGQIVEDYYGGQLELISPGTLGGATFQAILRKRVGT